MTATTKRETEDVQRLENVLTNTGAPPLTGARWWRDQQPVPERSWRSAC